MMPQSDSHHLIIACPCGSGKYYLACCGPYIAGEQLAPTPEALMRSRYTAYTQAKIDYIAATMKGKAALGFDQSMERSAVTQQKWLGLQVLKAEISPQDENIGFVEFIASYHRDGKKRKLHERSEFHRENARWYYVDGVMF
jgi:SEC-C motif domain protein